MAVFLYRTIELGLVPPHSKSDGSFAPETSSEPTSSSSSSSDSDTDSYYDSDSDIDDDHDIDDSASKDDLYYYFLGKRVHSWILEYIMR